MRGEMWNYKIFSKKRFDKKLVMINKKNFLKTKMILLRLEKWPPFEQKYNVHNLKWKIQEYSSINVTGDWRIIFSVDEKEKQIVLYDIGTHSELYG